MLPASGVTRTEPFTHPTLAKAPLYTALFWMIVRAYGRVRQDDHAGVQVQLGGLPLAGDIRGRQLPNLNDPALADKLEATIRLLEDRAPYVIQPGDRKNQPPNGAGQQVLRTMLDEAGVVLNQIAGGAADVTITNVFGLVNGALLPQIRQVYADAVTGLERLWNNRTILADDRGDLTTQGAGALSSPNQMLFPPSFFAARTDAGVRTLLHECFHVARADIIDHAYFGSPSFDSLSQERKLVNADHYGQVARVRANLNRPAAPPVAVNPGNGVVLGPGDVETVRAAALEATERLTRAWVRTLWSWQNMRRVRAQQNSWWSGNPDQLVATQLMRDSETCGLTLHRAPGGRSTAGPNEVYPFPLITDYDQAVLEEVISDTHALVGWAHNCVAVDVLAAAPIGAAPPHLTAGDVTSATAIRTGVVNVGVSVTGLADQLVAQATTSLANPWAATPAALKTIVDSLRVRDASGVMR